MNIIQIPNLISLYLFNFLNFRLNYFAIVESRINKTNKMKIHSNFQIHNFWMSCALYDFYEMDIILFRTQLRPNYIMSNYHINKYFLFKRNQKVTKNKSLILHFDILTFNNKIIYYMHNKIIQNYKKGTNWKSTETPNGTAFST